MTDGYGVRYIESNAFIDYCRDLNVKTDKSELEYYEKTGAILPRVRIIYPDDYIKLNFQWQLGQGEPSSLQKWPDLERLNERLRVLPQDYANLTDDELMDSFDREMGHNSYLVIPTIDSYRPWDSYVVLVPGSDGEQFSRSNINHYYSYWQVHQVWNVQQDPNLYRNRCLLNLLADDVKAKLFNGWPPDLTRFRQLNGMANSFDALSFWVVMFARERSRTFALATQKHQVQHLDDVQSAAYRARLESDAQAVQKRFGLTIDNLYEFLYQLIKLHDDYLVIECYRLSQEVRDDILHMARLVGLVSGATWDAIAEQLLKRYQQWTETSFRHLRIITKEHDEAHDVLRIEAEHYGETVKKLGINFPAVVFSGTMIDDLLDYFEHEGLSLMITALSGMVAGADNYEEKFRRVNKYSNLKNVATALEYLLKNLIIKKYPQMAGETLTPVVQKFMKNEKWFKLFCRKLNLTQAKDTVAFFGNLNQLLHDADLVQSEDTYWARVFLISCLTRNLTVHFYLEDDWFYAESYGEMLKAVVQGVLYVWQVAKREKLA